MEQGYLVVTSSATEDNIEEISKKISDVNKGITESYTVKEGYTFIEICTDDSTL